MEAVTGGRPLSVREEEVLGLLASFPDGGESDRELSFSDIVEAEARPGGGDQCAAPPGRDRGSAAALSPGWHEAASMKQREQAAVKERWPRRQRSGGGGSSRGSCGVGVDGVLLNFYVPGLLTRSATAPRPGRGSLAPPAGIGQGAPAKAAAVAAGKGRKEAPLGTGCWPALWGLGRDRRGLAAKACS